MVMFDPSGRSVSFRARLFGYDRAEVQAFIANLLEDYARIREEASRLRNRAPAPPAPKPLAAADATARDIQRMLESAQRVADDIERRAVEEGVGVVTEARAHAADILEGAERRAAEITDEARREVARLEARAAALQAHGEKLRAAFEAAADAAGAALGDLAGGDLGSDVPSDEAASVAV
jgi:cell division septum initiation protein DivIVA